MSNHDPISGQFLKGSHYSQSAEHRRKIGEANRGKKKTMTPEWREHIRLGHIGKPHPSKPHKQTEATKKKLSLAHLGIPRSEETKAKLRQYRGKKHWNFGRKMPLETRIKLGKSREGSKSHFWRGGINKKHLKIRGSLKYALWREAVYARDKYTCVLCGAKGVELNADHIKSFSFFPKLRFEISNGRTLCVPCHKKTDNYGGKKSVI